MKENKEETQLRSAEEMTLQQCKEEIAKGRNWESYRTFYLMAGFPEIIQVNDEAAELYASQFKSHSPINHAIEVIQMMVRYCNEHEDGNTALILEHQIELLMKSQSLPIEGGEREMSNDVVY